MSFLFQLQPDRIVEHLSSCIVNLDLVALREAWTHLDQRFFARLEHSFLSTARKLENALLRMYLVTCLSSGRHDKLLDFFEKMTPDLQGQPEWKEWFGKIFITIYILLTQFKIGSYFIPPFGYNYFFVSNRRYSARSCSCAILLGKPTNKGRIEQFR